jgi:O-antigen/teichoic acid export membrane protein
LVLFFKKELLAFLFSRRCVQWKDDAMAGVRRAFFWASAGRYVVMAVNLGATVIMARLLTPAQFGVTVLGGAVLAVAEGIRAIGGGAYIVQHRALTPEDIRTNFTVSLCVTIVLTACLALLGAPLARYFDTPDLYRYLRVAIFGFMTGPVVYSILALMSRRMAFGIIAANNVLTTVASAVCGIFLAARGFSYMSVAWAQAISAIVGMLMYLRIWNDWSIFRPMLGEWRRVMAFGAFDSATGLLSQIAESLPFLIFGRLLNVEAVGLCQRTLLLCLVPERVVLAGVGAVALPAFAQQMREASSLKQAYLRAIELITVALWPALLLLVLLADPIVSLLLGARWFGVVPLVRVLGTALLFSFPVTLHYPAMVAVGAIRYMPLVVLAQGTVSIGIITLVAKLGLYDTALAMLFVVPMNGVVSLALARHFIGFRWRDVAIATRKSVVCAVLAAGPMAIVLGLSGRAHMPAGTALVGVATAGFGWAGGVLLTGHPVLHEVSLAVIALRDSKLGQDRRFGVIWAPIKWFAAALARRNYR